MEYKIKMFSDYIWPFCYMGKGVVKELESKYNFELEHVGFEIHPETPQNGSNLYDLFPGVENMIENLKIQGKKYNINFGNLKLLSNSYKALLVGEYAKEVNKNDGFTQGIFKAYFEDCKDIGDEKVILEVAKSVDISEKEVKKALSSKKYKKILESNLQEGVSYGVESVPTFIINDKYKIVGAESKEAFERAFEMIALDSK